MVCLQAIATVVDRIQRQDLVTRSNLSDVADECFGCRCRGSHTNRLIQQEAPECQCAWGGRSSVGDVVGRASEVRGREGVEGDGRREHEEGDHGGRDSEEYGHQRVGAALLLRRQAHARVRPGRGLHATPRDRAAAGDGRQVVPERVRVQRRGARGHQLPPCYAGHGLGVGRREGHRAHRRGAALQPRHQRARLLRGRRAALHKRLAGAHQERRVHGRAHLRAVHGAR